MDAQVPPVCVVYAMMMNQRWQELSLVQKIATIILGVGHSSKKVILTSGGMGPKYSDRRDQRNCARVLALPPPWGVYNRDVSASDSNAVLLENCVKTYRLFYLAISSKLINKFFYRC